MGIRACRSITLYQDTFVLGAIMRYLAMYKYPGILPQVDIHPSDTSSSLPSLYDLSLVDSRQPVSTHSNSLLSTVSAIQDAALQHPSQPLACCWLEQRLAGSTS
jgi:hypothetical protein